MITDDTSPPGDRWTHRQFKITDDAPDEPDGGKFLQELPADGGPKDGAAGDDHPELGHVT